MKQVVNDKTIKADTKERVLNELISRQEMIEKRSANVPNDGFVTPIR